jgi:hypothetical protein
LFYISTADVDWNTFIEQYLSAVAQIVGVELRLGGGNTPGSDDKVQQLRTDMDGLTKEVKGLVAVPFK